MTDINTQKEDTKMTTNKKAKLTFAEAMTIINNASTENKIEVTDGVSLNYIIKIDDTNYIIYVPQIPDPEASPNKTKYINIRTMIKMHKLHLNKGATYNFTVVSKSPCVLCDAEFDRYENIADDFYHKKYKLNINIDILHDMIDNPNNIKLDDKKLRNMLIKARFTGSLKDLRGLGYAYTINKNNVIWYIPDDIKYKKNIIMFYMMHSVINFTYCGIFDNVDITPSEEDTSKDEITLNIHVVSDKKVFDTDFIAHRFPEHSHGIIYYVHVV